LKKEDLYKHYALDSDLKTYHYRVLFLLMQHERTQSEICSELGISKQNLNKICRNLLSIGYILQGKMVGRNKYLKINPNPSIQVKGQLSIMDLHIKE